MTSAITPKHWLTAARAAAQEFASTTLGLVLTEAVPGSEMPEDLTGCFVALVGDEDSIQIGFATNASGCQCLAKALFASEAELPNEDVYDALGEIANILAGGVKMRLASAHSQLAIGLPIVMEGHLRVTERQVLVAEDFLLDQVAIRLLILCGREA